MNVLVGKHLRKRTGVLVDAKDALQDKVVAIYFSAGWCPPCKQFTSILAEFYRKINDLNAHTFEIVFVSSDKTESDMSTYMQECHEDWLAIPFGHDIIKDLKKKYHITGIPKLVVVTDDGDVVTHEGRKEITQDGLQCFRHWAQAVRTKRGEATLISTAATSEPVGTPSDDY